MSIGGGSFNSDIPIQWDVGLMDRPDSRCREGWVIYDTETELFLQGDSWVTGFSFQLFTLDANNSVDINKYNADGLQLVQMANELLLIHCRHYEMLMDIHTRHPDGEVTSGHVMLVYQDIDFMDVIILKDRYGHWS